MYGYCFLPSRFHPGADIDGPGVRQLVCLLGVQRVWRKDLMCHVPSRISLPQLVPHVYRGQVHRDNCDSVGSCSIQKSASHPGQRTGSYWNQRYQVLRVPDPPRLTTRESGTPWMMRNPVRHFDTCHLKRWNIIGALISERFLGIMLEVKNSLSYIDVCGFVWNKKKQSPVDFYLNIYWLIHIFDDFNCLMNE